MSLKQFTMTAREKLREQQQTRQQRQIAKDRLSLMRERKAFEREKERLAMQEERERLRASIAESKAKRSATRGSSSGSSAKRAASSVGRWLIGAPAKPVKRAAPKHTTKHTTTSKKRKITKVPSGKPKKVVYY